GAGPADEVSVAGVAVASLRREAYPSSHDPRQCSADATPLRRNRARRPVVAHTGRRLFGIRLVPRLHHVGRLPERALPVRSLPLAPVLARAAGLRPRVVRAEAGLVAGLVAVLPGVVDPLGARRVPPHLLLLPGGLLQGVLGGPSGLYGGRAARRLPR